MTEQDVIDEVKLELTGDVLELEIEDSTIEKVIKKVLRELQRYWDETCLVTVPFASCIDYSGTPLADSCSIVAVYRTAGYGDADIYGGTGMIDPMYAQQWMIFSNAGTMYNLSDYVLNYAAWSTLSQIKNTMSTDLAFKEDKYNCKLYINNYTASAGNYITIEYIPKLSKMEQIQDDYWQDIAVRMTLYQTKILLGRIRTRFTQSSALWTQDGERMLEEGTTSLNDLREVLRNNSNLIYPID